MKKFVVGFIFGIIATYLITFIRTYFLQDGDIRKNVNLYLYTDFIYYSVPIILFLGGIIILYFIIVYIIDRESKAKEKAKQIIDSATEQAKAKEIKYKPIIRNKDNALKRLKEENKDLKQIIFGSYKLAKKVKNGESHIDQLIRILKRGNNG